MQVFLNKEQFAGLEDSAEQLLLKTVATVATVHGLSPTAEVSVTLVGDQEMQEINRDWRGIDNVTDVISFALDEGEEPEIIGGPSEELLGEIVVCVPQAERQAVEYGHSFERELAYLIVHGMLHLLGYDHMNEEDKAVMRKEEEVVLQKLCLTRGGD